MSKGHAVNLAFADQKGYCARLGSKFMARACEMFAQNLSPDAPFTRFLYTWPGDISPQGINLPLRLFGAMHYLVFGARAPKLAALYPPNDVNVTDTALWNGFEGALKTHGRFIQSYMKNAPQTNEVGRAAILLPGFMKIAQMCKHLPLVLSEIGASAGLNQNWDKFQYTINGQNWGDAQSPVRLNPDWRGPSPELCALEIHSKAACDLSPVALQSDAAGLRLLSYIWPDQNDRLRRTKAAIHIAKAQKTLVEKADAFDWLNLRLGKKYKGAVHVIFHTIVWQYLPQETKARAQDRIERAGQEASSDAPLAWLAFEADGRSPGAALSLRYWPGGQKQVLARADYHGRWIEWAAA